MQKRRLIPIVTAVSLALTLCACGSSPKFVLLKTAKAVLKADTVGIGVTAEANVTVDNPIYPLSTTLSGTFDVAAVPEDGQARIEGSVGAQIMKRDISVPLQAYATGTDTARSTWYVSFPLKGSDSRWQKLTVSSSGKDSPDIKALLPLAAAFADTVKLTETAMGARECYKISGKLTGAQLKSFDLGSFGRRIDSNASVQVSALLDRRTCEPIKMVLYSDDLLENAVDFGEFVGMSLDEISVTLNFHLDDEKEAISLPAEALDADSCTNLGDGLELKDSFRKLLGLG